MIKRLRVEPISSYWNGVVKVHLPGDCCRRRCLFVGTAAARSRNRRDRADAVPPPGRNRARSDEAVFRGGRILFGARALVQRLLHTRSFALQYL